MALDETSQPIELLLSVSRDGSRTLGAQIEDQLRRAIRNGALRPGARVPSTRDLARQIGVSRRVVVDAYAQLAAEGYLSLRQGARPRVSQAAAVASEAGAGAARPAPRARFDFRPSMPDVSTFPRAAWLRSLRQALATVTEHIGLIATGSTTFEAPFHVARRFASLDHISGGRAAWNIVTTSNPDAALNFGLDDAMEHDERYRRAREFYDVVTGLWDSWAEDAFIRNVETGEFFDPSRMHVLDHKGKYYSVRGPLHIARPVQGWPVIVQAGSSDAGRQLAAETAEAVFAGAGDIKGGRAL